MTRYHDNQSQTRLDGNEVRSQVRCTVRLTDDDGTQAGDNPRLSLNWGVANWRVNPRRWNRLLDCMVISARLYDRTVKGGEGEGN